MAAELYYDNWRRVDRDGFPEDGAWCIVTWKSSDGEMNIFAGGYSKEEKQFYANFGLGGAILEAERVISWTDIDDYKWRNLE